MSRRRLMILAASVAVLFITFGVYYILTNRPADGNTGESTQTTAPSETTDPQETTEEHDANLFDFLSIDIQKVIIEKKDSQRLVLDKETRTETVEGGEEIKVDYFLLAEPSGYIIDEDTVRSIYSAAAWIYESRYIGSVDSLDEFGLTDPQASVTVILKNGETHVLNIGDKTLGEEGYYVAKPDSNKVSMVSIAKVESLLIDLKSLLIRNIFDMEIDKVTEFSIIKKGQDEVIIRKKSEQETTDVKGSFETFKMIQPVAYDANSGNIQTNIEMLLGSEVAQYIELDAKDLAQYGLADPLYKVKLKDSDGQVVSLDIGNNTEDNFERYARFEGMNAVFTLRNDSLLLIDMPLKEMVTSFIYIVNIQNVDEIYFKAPGYEVKSRIEHVPTEDDKTEEKFIVNGLDANAVTADDKSYFRAFYQSLLSVFVNSFDLTARPAFNPEITIIYGFGGTEEVRIDYVKKDDFFYYAFVDRKYTGILVRNTDFSKAEGVLSTIQPLLDNLK